MDTQFANIDTRLITLQRLAAAPYGFHFMLVKIQ